MTQTTQFVSKLRSAFLFVYRLARRFALVIGVVVAVLLVSTLTIDLGPALRARAEIAGSNWLERKLTIGRLGVHLGRGKFVVEDLRVEGMLPGEPPWLVAKHIAVSLTWGALLGREVLLDDLEMTDWRMVVESFPDGRQTIPRLSGPPRAPISPASAASQCAPASLIWSRSSTITLSCAGCPQARSLTPIAISWSARA